MNNESLKENFSVIWVKHKPKFIIGLALIVSFTVGYGTASVEGSNKPTPRQLNYTTKPAVTPSPSIVAQPSVKPSSVTSATSQTNCKIKGNIGSGSKKTYHMPDGAFYDRTIAEMCFNTEQEAVNAGFTKSSR